MFDCVVVKLITPPTACLQLITAHSDFSWHDIGNLLEVLSERKCFRTCENYFLRRDHLLNSTHKYFLTPWSAFPFDHFTTDQSFSAQIPHTVPQAAGRRNELKLKPVSANFLSWEGNWQSVLDLPESHLKKTQLKRQLGLELALGNSSIFSKNFCQYCQQEEWAANTAGHFSRERDGDGSLQACWFLIYIS